MDLGDSLKRRRGGSRRSGPGDGGQGGGDAPGAFRRSRRRRTGVPAPMSPKTFGWIAGAGVVGLGLGWFVATVILFPAPEPPADVLPVPGFRGVTLEEARTRLEAAGLAVGTVEYLNHPSVDSGAVLGQSPLPGQVAIPGDSVRVTMSLGPERRTVPRVSRLRSDQAVALLEATGFRVRVDSIESREPRGRILTVIPGEGEELTLPGAVNLRVSLGPPAVVMPDLLKLPVNEAQDSLTALGLVVSEVEEVFRFGRDQGRVVSQDPPSGRELERGTAVRLVIGRRSGGNPDRDRDRPQDH